MTRRVLVAAVLALALAPPAGAATAAPGGLVRQGKHLYGEYCLSCHGMNGAGRTTPTTIGAGPLRAQSQQRAVAPSLQGVGAAAADFYLRTGYMPLQRVGVQPRRGPVLFSNRQIRALVAYVASLAPGPPIPKPQPKRGSLSAGQKLFTERCAGCHQVVAQGGYVTGATPPPLGNATAVQIAEAVRIGPYVMPKFRRSEITNGQLDSIIRYVEYTKHPSHPGGWALGYLGPVPEGIVTWLLAAVALLGLCVAASRRLRS